MSEILDQVKEIISAELEVQPEGITMESIIVDDLGADSLDVVELVMRIEERFDIEIPDEDAEKIQTVGNIVEYLKNNITQ